MLLRGRATGPFAKESSFERRLVLTGCVTGPCGGEARR